MCARSEKQVCVQVHITRAGRYPNRLSTHLSELLLLIPLEKQASLPANLLAPVLFVILMRAAGRICAHTRQKERNTRSKTSRRRGSHGMSVRGGERRVGKEREGERTVLLGMGHRKAGVLGSHRRGDRQAQQDDAEQAHVCVRLVKTAVGTYLIYSSLTKDRYILWVTTCTYLDLKHTSVTLPHGSGAARSLWPGDSGGREGGFA